MRILTITFFYGVLIVLTAFGRLSGSKEQRSSKIKVTNADLLKLFKEIQIDSLHVWAESNEPNGKKFQDSKMDTLYFSLFGDYMDQYKQYYTDPKTNKTVYIGYYMFARYKFPINNYQTGLIIRGPSLYSESLVS